MILVLLSVEEPAVEHEMERRPIIVTVGSVGIAIGPGGGGGEDAIRIQSAGNHRKT